MYLGIDIGSSSTELVLLNDEKKMEAYVIGNTGANHKNTIQKGIEHICAKAGIKASSIQNIVSTGYGRKNVKKASTYMTEISCHAMGIYYLFPQARTVIDVGGQDSKAIELFDHGQINDFAMNDKCAAGTGRYLEAMQRVLNISVEDMGLLCLKSTDIVTISNVCTVFAESEVISNIAQEKKTEDIVKGICYSTAKRIWALLQKINIRDSIAMTGGVAKNQGVVMCLEEILGKKLLIADEPQIVGALGAALFAFENEGKRK